jgi:hypothetical protein
VYFLPLPLIFPPRLIVEDTMLPSTVGQDLED